MKNPASPPSDALLSEEPHNLNLNFDVPVSKRNLTIKISSSTKNISS